MAISYDSDKNICHWQQRLDSDWTPEDLIEQRLSCRSESVERFAGVCPRSLACRLQVVALFLESKPKIMKFDSFSYFSLHKRDWLDFTF